jgi:hypothetical protein
MSARGGSRIYRLALRCYPRSFREEYGSDMTALIEDQLRDEHPSRVWTRAVVDLLVTIPARHLEVHMNRPPSFVLPALFAGLSTAGVLIVVIGGAGGATLATGSMLAVLSAVLAFMTWRDTRTVAVNGPADRWWQFLAAGLPPLLTPAGEISERVWGLMMVALAVSLALISTAVILGVARLARGREHATR